MSRKLILLNVGLIALTAWIGWMLRQHWIETQAHERAIFEAAAHPKPVLAPPPIAPPPSVTATQYIDVASKMLFASDRNPNVIIEAPKPEPPPPPMPALPAYFGQMNFGQPTVILSTASNQPQKSYHAGEKIGPFEIVSFDKQKITFKWNDKPVEKKLDELIVKEAPPELTQPVGQVVQVVPGSQPSVPVKSLGGSSTDLANKIDEKVGVDMGGGFHGCVTGDNSPAGTIVNGYKKVVTRVLMGMSCHWEPVLR
jgi:hypothetical protein